MFKYFKELNDWLSPLNQNSCTNVGGLTSLSPAFDQTRLTVLRFHFSAKI